MLFLANIGVILFVSFFFITEWNTCGIVIECSSILFSYDIVDAYLDTCLQFLRRGTLRWLSAKGEWSGRIVSWMCSEEPVGTFQCHHLAIFLMALRNWMPLTCLHWKPLFTGACKSFLAIYSIMFLSYPWGMLHPTKGRTTYFMKEANCKLHVENVNMHSYPFGCNTRLEKLRELSRNGAGAILYM